MTEQTLFEQLNSKNVNDHTEQKKGLTYLAWSYAHQELKKIDPNYTVKVHEFPHPDINTENYFDLEFEVHYRNRYLRYCHLVHISACLLLCLLQMIDCQYF
uniref:Sak single strand annealing protein n=1 Tax=Staphylococcus aureus TaxID=1280 RepID=UPI00210CDCFD